MAIWAGCADAQAQRLADFKRVVVVDDALPAQKASAEELAHCARKTVGQEIATVPLSR